MFLPQPLQFQRRQVTGVRGVLTRSLELQRIFQTGIDSSDRWKVEKTQNAISVPFIRKLVCPDIRPMSQHSGLQNLERRELEYLVKSRSK